MPIDDVLDNLVDVKRRVAMIPYSPNQTAATKEALSLAVAAMEHLAQVVAEIDARTTLPANPSQMR